MKVNGFTLIELLVIAGIIVFLLAITIPLYRAGENRSALQRTSHKLAQDIRRAQELAVSSQDFPPGQPVTGGYGVYFEINLVDSYIIFADKNKSRQYEDGEKVEEAKLEKGVKITGLFPSPLNIVFVPPDPEVFIKNLPPEEEKASIKLESQGEKREITVNKAGLIEI